jgi:hypothetical protein
VALGLVVGISPSGAARAGVTVQVEDFTQTFTETSPSPASLSIDKTFSVPHFGDGEAFVISHLGRMGTILSTPAPRNADGSIFNLGSYQLDAILSDRFTVKFVRPPQPGAALTHIPGSFDGHGMITLPPVDAELDGNAGVASVSVNSPGGGLTGTLFDQVALTSSPGTALTGIPLVGPGSYPIGLTTDFSFDVDPNDPSTLSRDFTFDLRITGSNGVALDLFHTAQVSFDLPPGVTVTSEGGFFQSGPTSVPEPSTLTLLAIGIGMASFGAARQFWAGCLRTRLDTDHAVADLRS